jgi:hypothetical protein
LYRCENMVNQPNINTIIPVPARIRNDSQRRDQTATVKLPQKLCPSSQFFKTSQPNCALENVVRLRSTLESSELLVHAIKQLGWTVM